MSPNRSVAAFGVALFASALLFFNTSSIACAQEKDKKPEDPPKDKIEPKPRGQLYPGWRELGLTKDQIEQIYKIQTEHRAKIDALEAQIAKIKKDEKAKAEELLTPAQKARLREIKTGEPTDPPKDKPEPPKDKPVPPKDKPELPKDKAPSKPIKD